MQNLEIQPKQAIHTASSAGGNTPDRQSQCLWQPSPEAIQSTAMYRLQSSFGFANYDELWQWSVNSPEEFWSTMWDIGGVIGDKGQTILSQQDDFIAASWFPDASLNYAENLLKSSGDETAIVFWGEDQVKRRLSKTTLRTQVAQFQQFLREQGVGKGDRVAGLLPNMPETIIAMLATTALGAIWSSASPDFGVQGVLDRFQQIEPKVLIGVDGYFYNGKTIDCRQKNRDILAQMPTVERMVEVSYVFSGSTSNQQAAIINWASALAVSGDTIHYERVGFNHPLFIMFSSGTTGVPKCIVHCHGGVLLQHLKEHQLHSDIRSGDRVFYYSTCGWMMWNWLATCLASDAAIMLFDGSPFINNGYVLFDFAAEEKITHLGISAKYIESAGKAGVSPINSHALEALRVVLSTGSPLSPDGFDWVYTQVKPEVQLSSISGGTDILSCFVLGNPILPVYRGEIQCRGLGMNVQVFNPAGESVVNEQGELVCLTPFPSKPISFWNDADGAKYFNAYFAKFKNIWYHGDFCEINHQGGITILGRSDATLNPGGVRIGTAEIYRQVELLPEVLDAIVVGQDWPPEKPNDVRVVLFVKLQDHQTLTDELILRIKQQIRSNTTNRHVPAKVIAVPDVPKTKSGKLAELAVRNVIHGKLVTNAESLSNPECLAFYQTLPELSQ